MRRFPLDKRSVCVYYAAMEQTQRILHRTKEIILEDRIKDACDVGCCYRCAASQARSELDKEDGVFFSQKYPNGYMAKNPCDEPMLSVIESVKVRVGGPPYSKFSVLEVLDTLIGDPSLISLVKVDLVATDRKESLRWILSDGYFGD